MARTYRLAELSWGNSSMRFSNIESDPQAEHYLNDLKGLFGGVGVKGEDQARMGHGDFQSRKHRGPKIIQLEATLVYPTEDARDEADFNVSGILWDGEPGTLTYTSKGLTVSTSVELNGPIAHEYVGTKALRIQVPLKAPSPFLLTAPKVFQVFPAGFGEGLEYKLFSKGGVLTYGNSVSSSKVAITNNGTAEATPKFIVRGDFPSGVSLTDGRGNTVELPIPIYKQSPVTIDMDGSVLINGFDQSSALTQRDWFTVGPKETIQPRLHSIQDGTGWVDIEISDTYI